MSLMKHHNMCEAAGDAQRGIAPQLRPTCALLAALALLAGCHAFEVDHCEGNTLVHYETYDGTWTPFETQCTLCVEANGAVDCVLSPKQPCPESLCDGNRVVLCSPTGYVSQIWSCEGEEQCIKTQQGVQCGYMDYPCIYEKYETSTCSKGMRVECGEAGFARSYGTCPPGTSCVDGPWSTACLYTQYPCTHDFCLPSGEVAMCDTDSGFVASMYECDEGACVEGLGFAGCGNPKSPCPNPGKAWCSGYDIGYCGDAGFIYASEPCPPEFECAEGLWERPGEGWYDVHCAAPHKLCSKESYVKCQKDGVLLGCSENRHVMAIDWCQWAGDCEGRWDVPHCFEVGQ